MKKVESRGQALVYRITIDEKLEDDLIRVLVASLRGGVGTFDDEPSVWSEEDWTLVTPNDYAKVLGMTNANVKTWPWESLQEGQVFFRGMFKINQKRKTGRTFLVDTKRRSFRPVNYLIKERVKRKYLRVLERGY